MFVLFVDRVIFDSHQFPHNHNHGQLENGSYALIQGGNLQGSSNNDSSGDELHIEDEHEHPKARSQDNGEVDSDLSLTKNLEDESPSISKMLEPIMIIIAMGIHASFAGLALGAISDKSGFFGFLFAILFHKWAESLTVGISMAKAGFTGLKAYLLVFIFSLATPFGAVIGLIFSGTNSKLKGVLLAISAGTFLYIACVEIISEEYQGKGNKFWKFLMTSLGIGLMILIWFIEQWFGED